MQKVILVGNPNTGKTTLFNTLAKASEHASNWHGVTVEVKEKPFKIKNKELMLCDLPGVYSLDSYSKEEQIASDFIADNSEAIIVCIVDANNLGRNLFLALELLERSNKVIIAVNMAKEVPNLDTNSISSELGVQVVKIDARKQKGVKDLLAEIEKCQYKKVETFSLTKTNKHKDFSIEEFESQSKDRFDRIEQVLNRAKYSTKGFYGASKIDKFLLNGFCSFMVFFRLVIFSFCELI